jgi:DNA-binding NarL/FixJ family response regulator
MTQSEQRIADLVAEGLSNPEIARRLYVSRRTVETHVSHILRKLDLSSRVQLAAEAVRRSTVRS